MTSKSVARSHSCQSSSLCLTPDLSTSHSARLQVLLAMHGLAAAPDALPEIYRTALSYGSIVTRNEHRQYKRQKLTKKTRDMDLIMQTKPDHSRARRKQLKYLQREMSFLTHNADPFLHVLSARSHLLARAHLAFYRMTKRHELSGAPASESVKDKKRFVDSLIGPTADAPADPAFVAKVMALINSVPECKGLTGLACEQPANSTHAPPPFS
jgi:hypothetical protein